MSTKIIMFDGPDGVGKTSQVELARNELVKQGYTVSVTRSHGGTPMGEALREVSFTATERKPLTDLYISLAIHSELQAALATENSAVVLVDRSPLSNWAYQVFGSGLEKEEAEGLLDWDMHKFNPKLVICYRANIDVLRERIVASKQKADYFNSKSDDYFKSVIEGYDFAAQRYGATIIDAERSQDAIHAETMQAITAVLD